MRKLNTIQRRNKLNDIFTADDVGNGGANHKFLVVRAGSAKVENDVMTIDPNDVIEEVQMQHGPRYEENSISGLTTDDLLEIARDCLTAFQASEMATREAAVALTHIETALLWLNKRTEDRAERGVLGSMKK